jgi:thioredoxin reductase (NADPH)
MIGAGPSALTAAIYTTRENVDTVLIEKGVIGGLAAITDWVDNYPGFSKGIEGLKLAEELEAQANRFGAKVEFGEVLGLEDHRDYKLVKTDSGEVKAKAVLIATGSDYKKLGVPGEAEFYGRGVHYCATCDGAFYQDKTLVVVGGGNSAVQEAIFLTRYATHIDMLVRSSLKASDVLQKDLQKYVDEGKITVHLTTTTDKIEQDGDKFKVSGTKDGKSEQFVVDGVFVFVGLSPNTGFLEGSGVKLDELGLVKTDSHLQTSVRGVFAAGDVRSGATMQIASAAGEGATAALNMREFIEGRD